LQEEVVFGPLFGSVEFFFGEVWSVYGEVYVDDYGYAVEMKLLFSPRLIDETSGTHASRFS
jgi:hypothetical protein